MEQLKQLFSLNDCVDLEERFYEIAKALFTQYAIEKPNYDTFLFKEIEFYYYSSKHRDIITHPRNSEPLTWYINDFGGIDLNFKSYIKRVDNTPISKYILNDDAYFGGILIRQLVSLDGKIELKSPLKVTELFRSFDACQPDINFPILKSLFSKGTLAEPEKRVNLVSKEDDETIAKKVSNILYSYDKTKSTLPNHLEQTFKDFISKKYRFIRN